MNDNLIKCIKLSVDVIWYSKTLGRFNGLKSTVIVDLYDLSIASELFDLFLKNIRDNLIFVIVRYVTNCNHFESLIT